MIAYLKGTVLQKVTKGIVINTGSIGYLVNITSNLWDTLSIEDEIELFISTRVREDDISLYGFKKSNEIDFFKQLINVNGIGAKMAMEILSSDQNKVKKAIVNGDIAFLCTISGIGKKTAERIIIELKSAIDLNNISDLSTTTSNKENFEATDALLNLGYNKYEINRILKDLPENISKTEDIITYFLRNV